MHVTPKVMQSALICAKFMRRACAAVSCVLLSCTWANVGAAEQVLDAWPIHRGDASLRASRSTHYPLPSTLQWRYQIGTRSITSLVGNADTAFVASGKGAVVALNIVDGTERWRVSIAGEQFSAAPSLSGERLLLGSDKGRLVALSIKDGSELWRFKAGGKFVGSANTYKRKDGRVSAFVVSWDNNLYAIDVETGKEIWRYATENRLNATPAVVENNVVFGGCDGFVRVLDADDGTELAASNVGSYIAAPVAVDWPRVYVGHHEAKFLCVEPFAEKTHWTYHNREEPYVAAPASNGSVIIFGSDDQRVHCVDKNGKAQWEFRTNGKVMSGAVIAGPHVYIGSDDGFLYVLDLKNGTKLWSYEVGAEIDCDPALINRHLCVSAHDGSVYAFRLGPE